MVVEYKGKPYDTIVSLAKHVSINVHTLRTRINSGYTIEQAVEMGAGSEEIKVFNKTFKTMKELTEFYGFTYSTYTVRIFEKGFTHEQAIKWFLEREEIIFEGKPYKSITDICNHHKMSSKLVFNRIYRGWSIRDAVLKPIRTGKANNKYRFRGIGYNSKREMSEEFGLGDQLVLNFAKKNKINFNEALEILIRFLANYEGDRPQLITTIPSVIYNGVWYDTMINFFKDINVDIRVTSQFMNRHNLDNHLIALSKMKQFKEEKTMDALTGEFIGIARLCRKYKTNNIFEKGYAKKVIVQAYPDLNFNPTGYCAVPSLDLKVLMEK
ncbi:hypothetical protein P9X10_01430 [Bacillus cereus]|nr:hypothetical protein [Bacillus cereus]